VAGLERDAFENNPIYADLQEYFVVDPIGQRLIGNPDHGGKDMMDMF
jgi:hypothetical protein